MDDQAHTQLRVAKPTPIPQLLPDTTEGSSSIVEGIVTVTWPYSVVNKSVAFILAERDVLLRRNKGQLRIEFCGPAGKAIADSGIGGGDAIRLRLDGAECKPAKTPTRQDTLDWQLTFSNRLLLLLRRAENENAEEFIDIDAPAETEAAPEVDLDAFTPGPGLTSASIPATPKPTTPRPRSPVLSFPTKRLASATLDPEEYSSPAFLKRARVSYGSLFEGGIDAIEYDGRHKPKAQKRSRFSMGAGSWRYSSRSPSPESERDVEEEEIGIKETVVQKSTTTAASSPQTPAPRVMVDEGCQTQGLDFSPSIHVQISGESRVPAALPTLSPIAGSSVEQHLSNNLRTYAQTKHSMGNGSLHSLETQHLNNVDTHTDKEHVPAVQTVSSSGHDIASEMDTNFAFGASEPHNSIYHLPSDQYTSSIGDPMTTTSIGAMHTDATAYPTPLEHHNLHEEVLHIDPSLHFQHPDIASQEVDYTIPQADTHSFFEMPERIDPQPWTETADTPLEPVRSIVNDAVQVIDSSSPAREPSPGEDSANTEPPATFADEDAEDEAVRHPLEDPASGSDGEPAYKDGGDEPGEDYDLRNYDRAHDDDDVEMEDEATSKDADLDKKAIQLDSEDGEEEDSEEAEMDAEDDGKERELSQRSQYDEEDEEEYEDDELDESKERIARGRGEYEYDEDEEGEQYDEEEYEEEEYDEEEYDEEEEVAPPQPQRPAAPKEPVFISLLSDSEDEEDGDEKEDNDEAREEISRPIATSSRTLPQVNGADDIDEDVSVADDAESERATSLELGVDHSTIVSKPLAKPKEARDDAQLGDEEEAITDEDQGETIEQPSEDRPLTGRDAITEVDDGTKGTKDDETEHSTDRLLQDDAAGNDHGLEKAPEPESAIIEATMHVHQVTRRSSAAQEVAGEAKTSPGEHAMNDVTSQDRMDVDSEPVENTRETHHEPDGTVPGASDTGRDQSAVTEPVAQSLVPEVQVVQIESSATRVSMDGREPGEPVTVVTTELQQATTVLSPDQENLGPTHSKLEAATSADEDVVMENALLEPPQEDMDEQKKSIPSQQDNVKDDLVESVQTQTLDAPTTPPATQTREEDKAQAPEESHSSIAAADTVVDDAAGQLPTPGETQQIDEPDVAAPVALVIDEDEEADSGPEEQIMAEFLQSTASSQPIVSEAKDANIAAARRREDADHHHEHSAVVPTQEPDILITAQSLRSHCQGHKKTRSSGSAEMSLADPSISLARSAATTPRSKKADRAEEKSSPTVLRVTRSKADHSDPSIALAKGSAVSTRVTRSQGSPDSLRDTRGASQSTRRSHTPEIPNEALKSPSVTGSVRSLRSIAGDEDDGRAGTEVSKQQLLKSLRMTLPDFLSLKTLRSSLGQGVDLMAVSTTTPPQPHRPKSGPRDYMLEVTLTDPSVAPTGVTVAHIFRPHQAALPVIHAGDVVLLRKFQVVSMKGRGFGIRAGDASAWAVFEKADDEMLPQIKGPPVEVVQEETDYAAMLRKWWATMDQKSLAKIDGATKKVSQAGKEDVK